MSYKLMSVDDPQSFAEFDCVLDAEVYHDVAKDSGICLTITGSSSCSQECNNCPARKFPERTVH